VAERLETKLDGVVLIEPQVHGDERGFMVESFSRDAWAGLGVEVEFVQHNHSRSRKGTLRGIHFQTEPGQAKLVRCARGEIIDVAVDLRRGSPTFGRWAGEVLSAENKRQLWIPEGFAHGFLVLSDAAEFLYKTTDYWHPQHEHCIRWDDPDLAVAWPVAGAAPLVSAKDAAGKPFRGAEVFTSIPSSRSA